MTENPTSAASPYPACRRSQALQVFALLLVVYLLTYTGRISSPDGEILFRTAQGLARGEGFAVRPIAAWPWFGHSRGLDGRQYSVFGPGQAVVAAPTAWLGRRMESLAPATARFLQRREFTRRYYSPGDDEVARWLVSSLPPVFTALTGASVCVCVLALTGSNAVAAACALLFGLATLAWAYSSSFFAEPLLGLLLCESFRHSLAARKADSCWPLLLAGAALGAGLTVHVTALLAVPALTHLIAASRERRLQRLAWFAAGAAPFVALLAVHNAVRFGSVLETGRFDTYAHFQWPWLGLYGLLLSAGKGAFLFCPVALVSIIGWQAWRQRDRVLSQFLGFLSAVWLLGIASRSDWHGGFCIGPRHVVPLMPFIAIAAAPVIRSAGGRTPSWARGVIALSVAVQVLLLRCDVFDWLFRVRDFVAQRGAELPMVFDELMNFFPGYSPLWGFWRFPPQRWLATDVWSAPAPTWLRGASVAVLATGIVCGVAVVRTLRCKESAE